MLAAVASPEMGEASRALVGLADTTVLPLLMKPLGDPSVTPRCVALLASESWDIRRAALEALARIGAPFELAALRPVLTGDDLVLRGLAQKALSAALGPERWQEAMQLRLQRALHDPAREYYEEALDCFERRDLSGAAERVRKALRRVRKPEYYGLLGLIQLRDPSAPVRRRLQGGSARSNPPEDFSGRRRTVVIAKVEDDLHQVLLGRTGPDDEEPGGRRFAPHGNVRVSRLVAPNHRRQETRLGCPSRCASTCPWTRQVARPSSRS